MIAEEVLDKLVSKESSIEEGVFLDYYWVIDLLEGYSYEISNGKILFSDGSSLDLIISDLGNGDMGYMILGKDNGVLFFSYED